MPYASKRQQRAMHAKANRGEIAQSVVKEFDAATDFKSLPEKSPVQRNRHIRKAQKHSGKVR